ncbi:MAG: hypothetical protein RIS35_715 [Pseudomonadota bacterium]|jgi:hypothetical protein
MTEPLTGGCLCGAIRYELQAPVEALVACYCSDCRHASGTAASINARVPASGFRIVSGRTRIFGKAADSGRMLHRHFCGDCGSPIYSQHADGPDLLILKAGSLDRQQGMQLAANIWVRSAPPWARVDATVPSFEEGRPPPAA